MSQYFFVPGNSTSVASRVVPEHGYYVTGDFYARDPVMNSIISFSQLLFNGFSTHIAPLNCSE